MLKVLLKKQMMEIYRIYFYDAKKNTARSKTSVILRFASFMLLMLAVLGGMFTALSLALCAPMAAAGMDWMYFALMGLLAILLGIFGSVFNTYAGLYLAKDNDLLLSMPIPVNAIMASRLLSVYLMGLMYAGIELLPAIIVYWVTVSAGIRVVAGSLLFFFMISIFVLTLSCALGWVVARISLKLKNKSMISVLVSLLFFALYYFCCYKAQTVIAELIANAALYGEAIKDSAYPIYVFGNAALGSTDAAACVSAVVLLLFGAMWMVLSRSFLRVATASGKTEHKKYREGRIRTGSADAALLEKEFSHFLSSPTYMLNCGMATLLLPVFGIMLLIRGQEILSAFMPLLDDYADGVPLLFGAVLCLIASLNDTAAPSVSLEGRSLWQLQSLPIRPWQALRAKLLLQVIITAIPLLIAGICTAITIKCGAVETVLLILMPQCTALLLALFGLTMSVKLPNFTWTSEIKPIKQSAGVAGAIFGGMLYAMAMIICYILFGHSMGSVPYMAVCTLLSLLLSAVLYLWLKKKGSALFAAL